MGTLSSELGSHVERFSDHPRIYADANVPAGIVAFMRTRLKWDVLFVLEHDDLRRATDREHYLMAHQIRRTLVSLDHDFFDEHRFPHADGAGVIVISAPDERRLARVLRRVDRVVFHRRGTAGKQPVGGTAKALPLSGQKLHAHPGWTGRQSAGG